jgi:hypothetical protein
MMNEPVLFTSVDPDDPALDGLDDELKSYVGDDPRFGKRIRHPLVYGFVHPGYANSILNEQLSVKEEALERARDRGDWESFIFLHRTPYRLGAFYSIADELNDPQYWEMLRDVYTDVEFHHEQRELLEELLFADRSQPELIMDEEERAALSAMSETLTIYRGCSKYPEAEMGFSWTLDQQKARWFAHRFGDNDGYIVTATCQRSDVIAYLTDRDEAEIVIDPVLLEIKKLNEDDK